MFGVAFCIVKNRLCHGDNLPILRGLDAGSIALVYMDPPFNSDAVYEAAGRRVFSDEWRWGVEQEINWETLVKESVPKGLLAALQALRVIHGESPLLAYLLMMAPRLLELRRLLSETGSLFLHCDPKVSPALRLLLDAVFGPKNFRNEIAWKRSQTRSSIRRVFRRAHDVVLFYSRSERYAFNLQFKPLSAGSKGLYSRRDDFGLYQAVPLLVSGRRNGQTGRPWRGIDPTERGKAGMHWITTPDRLDAYDRDGLITWPQKVGGTPRLKYYLASNPGVPLSDFWDDADFLAASSRESLGFPTQKPEALLARIILAATAPGDLVLDPFCGSGTTLAVAERLGRPWIGIDQSDLAIETVKKRVAWPVPAPHQG